MATLSDEELMLLEQITYIDKDVCDAAGVEPITADKLAGKSVDLILSRFDKESIEKLRNTPGTNGSLTSYSRWADIIEGLQNSKMKHLQIDSYMRDPDNKDHALAIAYTDPNNNNKPYVTFVGTSGANEWADNARALNQTDSPRQLDALAYINSLPFDDITVVGHSKGSNKAMYVTILSDKVTGCVGMDGQGFSREFLLKYAEQIQEKGGLITNYSMKGDFVNILLNQIPGSNQLFVYGSNPESFAMNHSPGLFFSTYPLSSKILIINGKPWVDATAQRNPGLNILADFTQFMNMNASYTDKDKLSRYMGPLLGYIFGQGEMKDKYKAELDKVPEGPAMIFAYLGKFIVTEDLNEQQIKDLSETVMDMIGIPEGERKNIRKIVDLLDSYAGMKLKDFFKLLGDGKQNKLVELILKQIGPIKFGDMEINLIDLWREAEKYYPEIDVKENWKNSISGGGRKIDFTEKAYQIIVSVMDSIDQGGDSAVDAWRSYSAEDWYADVRTELAAMVFERYFNLIEEVNGKCRDEIGKVFEEVGKIDTDYKSKIETDMEDLAKISKSISELAQKIG